MLMSVFGIIAILAIAFLLSSGKRRKVDVDKLSDANFAGTAKSMQTSLFLTEGDR